MLDATGRHAVRRRRSTRPGDRPGAARLRAASASATAERPAADAVLHDVTPRRSGPAARWPSSARPAPASRRSPHLAVRLLDPDTGDGHARRRRPARAGTAASSPTRPRWCRQATFLFDDTVRGNVTLGADVDDDGVWRGAAAQPRPTASSRALPDGSRHGGRRARHHAVRRSAAAARAGPRAGPPAAAAGARRRDLQRRPAGRGGRSCAGCATPARRHGRRHRLPAGHDRARRRGRLPRGRPGPRPRHARAADGDGAGLPRRWSPPTSAERSRARRWSGRGPERSRHEPSLSVAAPASGGAIVTFRAGFRMAPELRPRAGLHARCWRCCRPPAGWSSRSPSSRRIDHGLARRPAARTVDLGRHPGVAGSRAVAVRGHGAGRVPAERPAVHGHRDPGWRRCGCATFRHVHDLSMLHQQASQRRGALVSRVTSDVDQLSNFLQWGGIQLLVQRRGSCCWPRADAVSTPGR